MAAAPRVRSDIGSQDQAVPDMAPRLFLEGPDVSRLERRKGLLAHYSAQPPVHVGDDGPEDRASWAVRGIQSLSAQKKGSARRMHPIV